MNQFDSNYNWRSWVEVRNRIFSVISDQWSMIKCNTENVFDQRFDYLGILLDEKSISEILWARAIVRIFTDELVIEGVFDNNIAIQIFQNDPTIPQEIEEEISKIFKDWIFEKNKAEVRFIFAMVVENLNYLWPSTTEEGRVMLSFSNNMGIFFTPPEIMDALILRSIKDSSEIISRVGDPFAGLGLFAGRLAEHLIEIGSSIPEVHINEIDPFLFSLSSGLMKPWMNSIGCELFQYNVDALNPGFASVFGICEVIVTNPPYSRLKFHKNEMSQNESFFGEHLEEKIESYVKQKKAEIKAKVVSFRAMKHLESACQGELDLYKLGLAACLNLIPENGKLAAIVPASICADLSSTKLRNSISNQGSIEFQVIHENIRLFPTVNQPTVMMNFHRGVPSTISRYETPKSLDEIRNPIFSGRVDLSLIEAMWPGKSYWFMADHEILEERLKLVNSVRLGDSASIKVARGECDLTKHRSRISSNHKMTLIRGDNIHRFVERGPSHGNKEATIDQDDFIASYSKIEKQEQWSNTIKQPRLVNRQVSYIGQPRRLIWTILESPAVVSNSCNFLTIESESQIRDLKVLLAILNSSPLDRFFRLASSNNHVSTTEIYDLPLPILHDEDKERLVEFSDSLIDHYSKLEFGMSEMRDGKHHPLEKELDDFVMSLFENRDSIDTKEKISAYS